MTRKEAQNVAAIFRRHFGGRVLTRRRPGTKQNYNFDLISPEFSKMKLLKRQDVVYDFMGLRVKPRLSKDINLVFTYAPEELTIR